MISLLFSKQDCLSACTVFLVEITEKIKLDDEII